jgi:hypothetical protein
MNSHCLLGNLRIILSTGPEDVAGTHVPTLGVGVRLQSLRRRRQQARPQTVGKLTVAYLLLVLQTLVSRTKSVFSKVGGLEVTPLSAVPIHVSPYPPESRPITTHCQVQEIPKSPVNRSSTKQLGVAVSFFTGPSQYPKELYSLTNPMKRGHDAHLSA